ncbi:MAG: hypothetical protein Kow0047_12020 [Anaerolineae bacterium]
MIVSMKGGSVRATERDVGHEANVSAQDIYVPPRSRQGLQAFYWSAWGLSNRSRTGPGPAARFAEWGIMRDALLAGVLSTRDQPLWDINAR